MRIVCAWCEKEGKSALICEIEPFDDPMETHGICVAHRATFLAELARSRAPGATGGPGGAEAAVEERPGAQAQEPQRLVTWVVEGQELMRRALPRLVEQVQNLEARCAAAERVHAELAGRVADAESRLRALRAENQRWRELQQELLGVLDPLIERILSDTIRPLYRLSRALRTRLPRPRPPGPPDPGRDDARDPTPS